MATSQTSATYRRVALLTASVVLAGLGYFYTLATYHPFLEAPFQANGSLLSLAILFAFQSVVALTAVLCLHRKQNALQKLGEQIERNFRNSFTSPIDSAEYTDCADIAQHVGRLIEQIDESKATRQDLAEFDNLILSGADINAIIRRCLIAARMSGIEVSLMLRSDVAHLQIKRYALNGVKISKQTVSIDGLNEDHGHDAEFYRTLAAEKTADIKVCHPFACDDGYIGVLVASGVRALTESETKRLSDLVDRLSVAITNIRRSETLYQQAHFDALTGLINRRAFEERLQESLSRSKRNERGVVLFLDLDAFKRVNDTSGHEAGDRLLIIVAQRLRGVLRPEDTIARLGGDEFAIIATDCGDEKAISDLCERIIGAVTAPVFLDRMEHVVGTSIGIARYPDDGRDLDELLMKADSAMYKAKETGGSQFAFFDDSLKAANNHRILLETRLRSAIKQRTLGLHFQPKLNLKHWTIDHAEALMRWEDEELGVINPEDFVGVAEESGLIHEMLPIIIERSAMILNRAARQGTVINTIAINASPRQLMNEGFALSVLSMLDSLGVPHHKLEVEVTESVFAQDKAQIMTELHILRMAGIRIALDDFGTGYSSLNMLRELPLDVVKIDRAFITELETSAQARSMLKHLIDIADSLGLEVVAEGVETESQLQYLIEHDCDYVQGWLVSRALSERDFLQLAQSWQAQPQLLHLHRPSQRTLSH